MAKQISPNRTRYEVAGKHRQEFQQKLACCWRLKQFLQLCNAFLGLSSSNYQLEMVKHIKFDHVLDTIFCWFWAESVQCAVILFTKQELPEEKDNYELLFWHFLRMFIWFCLHLSNNAKQFLQMSKWIIQRIKEVKKLRQRLAYSSLQRKPPGFVITSLDIFEFFIKSN